MKPKRNEAAHLTASNQRDRCQTPPYALTPLLPYLKRGWRLWEPAAGEGLLVAALRKRGFAVEATDVLTGRNFFDWAPASYDAQVTNPPYSAKYEWLARSYALGKPFALLVPLDTLGAAAGQALFRQHGVEVIFLDQRVDFKMPGSGWRGSGASFPVIWLTHGLDIGRQMTFARLNKPSAQRRAEMVAGVEQLMLLGGDA